MNEALFQHLETIANLKVLSGANQFSVASYQRAAKAVREATKELGADDVASFPGVGAKIAKTAAEFLADGTSATYEELAKKVPVECLTMTRVQGIGAKKALKLWQHGIHTFDDLVKAATNDKVLAAIVASKIGISSVGDFKKAIEFARDTAAGRLPYATAKTVGDAVLRPLKQLPWPKHVELLGSIRRKQPTIKDLDIGVCANEVHHGPGRGAFESILQALHDGGIDFSTFNRGESKCSLRINHYGTTIACDIWLVEPWYWGSFLNYATGNKQHNIRLRALAQSKGMTISEYGIFKVGTEKAHKEKMIHKGERVTFVRGMGERLGGEKETDVYEILGLDYVEPEARQE
jgi:DNA polymerase (family 10)